MPAKPPGSIENLTKYDLRKSLLNLSQDKNRREQLHNNCKKQFNPLGVEKITNYIMNQIKINNKRAIGEEHNGRKI